MSAIVRNCDELDDRFYYLAAATYIVGINLTYIDSLAIFGIASLVLKSIACLLILCQFACGLCAHRGRATLVRMVALTVSIASTLVTHSTFLAVTLLFLVFGRGKKVDTVAKAVLVSGLFTLLLGVCSVGFAWTSAGHFYRESGFERYAIGFVHPNSFAACLLSSVLAAFYLYRGKGCRLKVMLLVVCLIPVTLLADSRTVAAVLMFLIVALLLIGIAKPCDVWSKINQNLPMVSVALAVTLSIMAMIAYTEEDQLFALVNSVFSGRIAYAHGYFESYGISILGTDVDQYISFLGQTVFTVDNAYCHLLLRYGLLGFVTYSFLLINSARRLGERAGSEIWLDESVALFLAAVAYSLFESRAISFEFSWILLYALQNFRRVSEI